MKTGRKRRTSLSAHKGGSSVRLALAVISEKNEKRKITGSGNLLASKSRVGMRFNAKKEGGKKMHLEYRQEPSFSRDLEKDVEHLRIIDRKHDRYVEKVSHYDSEEVVHRCEEPLSEHKGHGSAKSKGSTHGG